MPLIIDRQCLYNEVKAEQEKNESIPKKYLKLTCPLALVSNNNYEERLPIITTDELSQEFDNFFPGKKNITKLTGNKQEKNSDKISSNIIKNQSKTIKNPNADKFLKTGGKKNKTRKKQ